MGRRFTMVFGTLALVSLVPVLRADGDPLPSPAASQGTWIEAREAEPGVMYIHRRGEALRVTRVEDDYVMTAQVMERKPKGAFGFLALGRLPEPGVPPKAPPAPPSMQGSEVLSNITSHDPGKSAQTAMLHNDKSLASNVSFYRAQYQDWRVDTDKEVSRGKLHALAFTRGREQVVITIQSGRDGSHIVLNSVKHDLL